MNFFVAIFSKVFVYPPLESWLLLLAPEELLSGNVLEGPTYPQLTTLESNIQDQILSWKRLDIKILE